MILTMALFYLGVGLGNGLTPTVETAKGLYGRGFDAFDWLMLGRKVLLWPMDLWWKIRYW